MPASVTGPHRSGSDQAIFVSRAFLSGGGGGRQGLGAVCRVGGSHWAGDE